MRAAAFWDRSGDWSQRAEEETQWWLTQRHQRCGRACSRPRSALQTYLWSMGGADPQGPGSQLTWNTRLSRSWETSQLDFEPRRQNFETNTGGKLPNHVFHLSSLSQIPLQMFEHTAPLFLKLLVLCVCGCVSTLSIYESLCNVFFKDCLSKGLSHKRNTPCVVVLCYIFADVFWIKKKYPMRYTVQS